MGSFVFCLLSIVVIGSFFSTVMLGFSLLSLLIRKEVTAIATDDDEYEILDGPAAVPLYATVRTSGHDRKKKEIVEETLKEDDYYEFIQQVREVRRDDDDDDL